MIHLLTYLYLVSFVAVAVVFAFVWAAMPAQPSKRSLLAAGMLVSLWALADFFSNQATTAAEMARLSKAFAFVWAPIPFLLLRAALLYAGHQRSARSLRLTALRLLPVAACVWLVFSGALYREFVPANVNGLYFQSRTTGWQALVVLYFVSYVGWACWALIAEARRQGDQALRMTSRLLLFGLLPVVVVGCTVNGGLSVWGIDPPYLGSILASLFAVFGAVGTLQRHYFVPLVTVRRERDTLRAAVEDLTAAGELARERAEHRAAALQRQKMEALGRLSAGVAHDFSNQLAAIQANAEMLRESLGAEHELAEEVADILHAADSGRALTKQLLAFGREQPTRIELLDVGSVVAEQSRMLRRLLGGEVRVKVQAASEPVFVRMDRVQLEQVLIALATNASDAMPGGGELSFTVEPARALDRVAEGAQPVRIIVRDTGVGMTPQVSDRIFEPFFSTKGKHGTGLGLSTAYGIVTQAGGTLAVESAPGQGSSFIVSLPAAEPTPFDETAPASGEEPSSTQPTRAFTPVSSA